MPLTRVVKCHLCWWMVMVPSYKAWTRRGGFGSKESWHVWCHSKDGSCSMLLHGLIYTCIYYLYCAYVHVLYFSLYIHAAFLDIYIYIFANIHITIHTYMYIYIHVYNVSVNESVSHVRRISLEPYLSFREIPSQKVPSIEGGTQIGNVSYHKTWYLHVKIDGTDTKR